MTIHITNQYTICTLYDILLKFIPIFESGSLEIRMSRAKYEKVI